MTLFLVACASAAHAQTDTSSNLRWPTIVYGAAASADVASSVYAFHHGAREANPLINWLEPQGTGVMLGVGSVVDAAGVWAAHRYLGRRHAKAVRIALYALAGVRVGIAVHNIRVGRGLAVTR
jgi:hypothetical protein